MADTTSFEVVYDFDRLELVIAVDQVRREVGQRYELTDSATDIAAGSSRSCLDRRTLGVDQHVRIKGGSHQS